MPASPSLPSLQQTSFPLTSPPPHSSYLLSASMLSVSFKFPFLNLLCKPFLQPVSLSSSRTTIHARELQNRATFTFALEKKWIRENIKLLIPKQATRAHEIQHTLVQEISVTNLFRIVCSQNLSAPLQTCHILKRLLELKWPKRMRNILLLQCAITKSIFFSMSCSNVAENEISRLPVWFTTIADSLCFIPIIWKTLMFSMSSKHNWPML